MESLSRTGLPAFNLVRPGANYGWPLATFGSGYEGQSLGVNSHQPGTELPIHYWVPLSIAPSSLAVETQPATTEIWIGALAGEMVVQLTLADNCVLREQRLFRHQFGRIRDVRVDASGSLYLLTDGGEGMLYRVELPQTEIVKAAALIGRAFRPCGSSRPDYAGTRNGTSNGQGRLSHGADRLG